MPSQPQGEPDPSEIASDSNSGDSSSGDSNSTDSSSTDSSSGMNDNPSRADYLALIDAIDGAVWEAHGPNWMSTRVSAKVETMFGYTPEAWLEPTFWEAHLHPDDRAAAVAAYEQAVLERRSYRSEYRFMASDGYPVWVRDIGSMVIAADSFHIRGVMLDINVDRKARILEQDRNDVLELVARNAPLEVILERLMGLIATQQPEAVDRKSVV